MKAKGTQGGGFVQNKSDGPPDMNGGPKKFDAAKFNRRMDMAGNALNIANGAFGALQNLQGAKDILGSLMGGGLNKLGGVAQPLQLGGPGQLGGGQNAGLLQMMQGLMQMLAPLMKMLGGGAEGLGGMGQPQGAGQGLGQGIGQGLCNHGAQQLLPQLFQKIMGMQQGIMGMQQGIMGLQQGLMGAAAQGLGKIGAAPMLATQALSGATQGLMGTAQGLMGAAQGIMGALQQHGPAMAPSPAGAAPGLTQGVQGLQQGLQKIESGLMDVATAAFGTLGGVGKAPGLPAGGPQLAPHAPTLPMGHGPVMQQQPPVNITVNQLVFN